MQPTNAGFFFSPAIHFPFYFLPSFLSLSPHKNFPFSGKATATCKHLSRLLLGREDHRTTVMNGKTPPLPAPAAIIASCF